MSDSERSGSEWVSKRQPFSSRNFIIIASSQIAQLGLTLLERSVTYLCKSISCQNFGTKLDGRNFIFAVSCKALNIHNEINVSADTGCE